MKFEWDENKAAANLAKHGISFNAATLVFEDPDSFSITDTKKDYGETRINTTGMVNGALIATVTHTDRLGITRIISARHATRKERKIYHGR